MISNAIRILKRSNIKIKMRITNYFFVSGVLCCADSCLLCREEVKIRGRETNVEIDTEIGIEIDR